MNANSGISGLTAIANLQNGQGNQSVGPSQTLGPMAPTLQASLQSAESLLVANLTSVSLEKLVKSKLEVLFAQQKEAQVELNGLYNIVL